MKPDSPLAHAKHIVRAGLLLLAVSVVLTLGRSFFVPPSFGKWGGYRGDNVQEQMALIPRHGGNSACAACHDTEAAELAAGTHATLACETCHAPLSGHVVDEELVAEMPIHRHKELCLSCHRWLEARPAEQPQIREREHLAAQEVEDAGPDICLDCHAPHAPL